MIYHTLLLFLLIFAGLTFPDPPPEEEGILVNFGTDETGFGDFEPRGDDQQAGEPDQPAVRQTSEQVEEVVETTPPPAAETTPPDPRPVEQTQDVEETRVVEQAQPTQEELERQRQEQLERERREQLERERLEQERIERERQAKQERIERERRERAEQINNMGRNAFGRQGVGGTEGSEGVTEGSGNQGVTSGSPDADRYDTGGGLGDGISFGGLGSRRGSVPKPDLSDCEVTQRIEITVDIQVDREGNVISAIVRGGNYQDKCIWDTVVAAAKRSKFSPDQSANFRQTGWIKYTILP